MEGPCCFTSTEVRLLIRDGDHGGGGGGGGVEEEGERVKARLRISPEKDRRNRGPPPEQWSLGGLLLALSQTWLWRKSYSFDLAVTYNIQRRENLFSRNNCLH